MAPPEPTEYHGPLFALRRAREGGIPPHWDTLAIGASPPLSPGLLHLKMPDKTYVHHVDGQMSDARPLLLKTRDGWYLTCWMSPGKGTVPGTPIIRWTSDSLSTVGSVYPNYWFLRQSIESGYSFAGWPTIVTAIDPPQIEVNSYALRPEDSITNWLAGSITGNFRAAGADPGPSYWRRSFHLGWTTVDLGLMKRHLPPGTQVYGAAITFTVNLTRQRFVTDDLTEDNLHATPEDFDFDPIYAHLYEVTGDVQTTQQMINTAYLAIPQDAVPQRVDVLAAGSRLPDGGGVIDGHTEIARWSLGQHAVRDPEENITNYGTVTVTREVTGDEFAAKDFLDFALRVDDVGIPAAITTHHDGEPAIYSRVATAEGRWEIVLKGVLPGGF